MLIFLLPLGRHLIEANFGPVGGSPGCPIASGVLRCAEANAAIGELTAEHRRTTRAMMLARLQQGQAAGELPAQLDTQALAGFYAGVIQGMSVQAIDGASCSDLQKMVDLAMQAWPA